MASTFIVHPETTDFSSYTHILGNNEFDADMDIVESFVRAYSQPDNTLAQASVFNYYISRLLHYWDFTRDYAGSDKIITDLQKTSEYRQQEKLSPTAIQAYEQEFLGYIQEITREFATTSQLNLAAIQKGFQFIGEIACLETPNFQSELTARMFPLPNTVGLFGLNTYLYAYFEGIYLIGVPTTTIFYDQAWGCPGAFIEHDQTHSVEMETFRYSNTNEKFIYYTVLNDPNLTSLQKECHITNMWFQLHEINTVKINIHPLGVHMLIDDYNRMILVSGQDFYELYKSFGEITFTPDNIESLLRVKIDWDRIKAKESLDLKLKQEIDRFWEDIEQSITKGITDDINTNFKLYYVFAEWYSRQYFNGILTELYTYLGRK